MKRNCIFWALLLVTLIVSVGCPKREEPGPTPEPTPVVEPTIAPAPGQAVCHTPTDRPGVPPFCKDAAGAVVTCPDDPASLPVCD